MKYINIFLGSKSIVLTHNSTNKLKHRSDIHKNIFAEATKHNKPSLLKYEYIKFCKSKKAFILFVVFLINIPIYIIHYNSPTGYFDNVYKEYMYLLDGYLNENKINYISKEKDRIFKTIETQEKMYKAYKSGTISSEMYSEYTLELDYAYLHKDAFEKGVLNKVRLAEESDTLSSDYYDYLNICFVYDTGWKKIINPEFNWLLFASIIILSSTFVLESHGSTSFCDILKSTIFGRKNVFYTKYIFSIICSSFVVSAYLIMDVLINIFKYSFPGSFYPLSSISNTPDIFSNMPIITYAIITIISRAIIWMLFSVICCSISCITGNYIQYLTSVSLGIVITIAIPEYVPITISFVDLIETTNTINRGIQIFLLDFVLFIVVTILTYIKAYNSWVYLR